MRSTSKSALPDRCTITRPSGEPTLDVGTGYLTPAAPTTVYTGACRVRPRGSQELDIEVGDLHETLGPYVATLPHDMGDVRVDDYLTVTASLDAQLVGRSFQISHVGWSSWQIDRRLGLDDREQPQGIGAAS